MTTFPRLSNDPPVHCHQHDRKSFINRNLKTLFACLLLLFGCLSMYNMILRGPEAHRPDQLEHHRPEDLERHSPEDQRRLDLERLKWEQEWAHERLERKRETEDYEAWVQERVKDEAKRQPFFGEPVAAEHCVGWAKREYTARLWNTEHIFGMDRVEICRNRTVPFAGGKVSPAWCEDKGIVGGINAHWYDGVNGCRCEFGKFFDKGCVGPGSRKRRFESRLWNCPFNENAMQLCTTAPHEVMNTPFERPTFCEDRGRNGVVANWEIDWDTC